MFIRHFGFPRRSTEYWRVLRIPEKVVMIPEVLNFSCKVTGLRLDMVAKHNLSSEGQRDHKCSLESLRNKQCDRSFQLLGSGHGLLQEVTQDM